MDFGSDNSPVPLESIRCSFYNQAKGEIEELSALDSKFCQDVHFPHYESAPKMEPEMDPCVWQSWIENLTVMETNLSWLLKLSHAKFWCQVVNNLSLQAFLDSYLKRTSRFQASNWPEDVMKIHSAIHKLVFMVYIRMATNKESAKNFITTDFFAELIYENFLFDIPKIMDLCAIYGNPTNSPLLRKALSNVFKCQPNYNEDLKQCVETVMQIFRNINGKCGIRDGEANLEDETSSTQRPHRLSEGPANGGVLLDSTPEEISDIIVYASDLSFTLRRFLADVYPTACTVFQDNVKYLVNFYARSLGMLKDVVQDKQMDDLHLRSQMLAHLKIARTSLLHVVRQIANECLLQPALRASEVGDTARAENLADEYFHMLSDLLSESRFFQDFMRKLPILQDVQSLLHGCPGIDETRASFILGSIGAGTTVSRRSNSQNDTLVNGVEPARQDTSIHHHLPPASQLKQQKVDDQMQSLISAVRDVLPHLEEAFVQSCLLYYNRDCEKTINALLEGSIPDDLRNADSAQPETQRDSSEIDSLKTCQESDLAVTEVLQERHNVFDKDEFDLYENTNVDRSRIHKGKKNKVTLGKAPTAEMKQLYEKYSLVSDEEDVTEGFSSLAIDDCNMYEDEYDDMYDGLGVDANDADDTDNILNRRPFVTPRVFLQQRKDNSQHFKSEESEEEDEGPKPDHFIANPAELREKQEQRRKQQQEQRDKRRGGNRAPKSENSSSNVAQDRKRKDANKARAANHNRKKMASRKAAKGMGPV